MIWLWVRQIVYKTVLLLLIVGDVYARWWWFAGAFVILFMLNDWMDFDRTRNNAKAEFIEYLNKKFGKKGDE